MKIKVHILTHTDMIIADDLSCEDKDIHVHCFRQSLKLHMYANTCSSVWPFVIDTCKISISEAQLCTFLKLTNYICKISLISFNGIGTFGYKYCITVFKVYKNTTSSTVSSAISLLLELLCFYLQIDSLSLRKRHRALFDVSSLSCLCNSAEDWRP